MFYLMIFGGRDFNDYDLLCKVIYALIEKHGWDMTNITIIEGGAKGADFLGWQFAVDHNIPYLTFKADWKDFTEPCVIKYNKHGPYNALAGLNRNTTLVENATFAIGAWDGVSTGTKDAITKLEKAKKDRFIFRYKKE